MKPLNESQVRVLNIDEVTHMKMPNKVAGKANGMQQFEDKLSWIADFKNSS